VAQQQQLILLLTVIIVALAILSGMENVEQSAREANKDRLIQELLVVAGRAQAWYRSPAHLGGGGGSFTKLTLYSVNFDSVTINGNYVLSNIKNESFRVTGFGNEGSLLMVTIEAFADSVAIINIVQ